MVFSSNMSNNKTMKVINFFGGPGSGKSTTAAYVFSQLKIQGYSCQYINQYAKDCVYQKRFQLLKHDQLYILAKQNHKLKMLEIGGQIDFAIVDSPLLLSNIYGEYNQSIPKSFYQLALDYFHCYNNLNFFIQRNQKFESNNRIHNYEQSLKIDNQIKQYLVSNNIFFEDIKASKNVINQLKESMQLKHFFS